MTAPDFFLDPRGFRLQPPGELAPRPAALAGRRILILENEKLRGRHNLEPFVPALSAALREGFGVAETPVRQCAALDLRAGEVEELAARIAEERPDGVVALFGDAGAVCATLLIAIRLEGLGVPTVTLVTPGTFSLAATMAQAYCPGLPAVALEIGYVDGPERVAEEIRQKAGAIGAALRTPAPILRELARDPRLEALAPVAVDAQLPASGDPEQDQELFRRLHLTDGLPVTLPTPERVRRMLGATARDGMEILRAECAPTGTALTVEKVAINAVMAGCPPETFPFVLAAVEAMCDPAYNLDTAAITSHPSGTAVVVSGPLARPAGLQSGAGCLGPGFAANATIGRALTLILFNVLRAVPGLSSLVTTGSPAQLSYCFAENTEESPWPGLHETLAGPKDTTVTVLKAEGPHNFLDERSLTAAGLLALPVAALSTIANNNAYRPGSVLLILNPRHAQVVANDGWSQRDVQRYLHERARVPLADTAGRGSVPRRPAWMTGLETVPVTRSADDVILVVAGAGGPQSMVAPSWGFSDAVTRLVGHAAPE